jgi:hypothetical protein
MQAPMRRSILVGVLVVLIAVHGMGCYGPQMITRRLDDWTNEQYQASPWLMGNTLAWLGLRLAFTMTAVLDAYFNAYYFWALDAWPFGSNRGTPFPQQRPILPR